MDTRLLLAPSFEIWNKESFISVPHGANVEDEKPAAGDRWEDYGDPDFL